MRTSRRYEVRLASPLSTDLEAFARSHGLSLVAAVRVLVRHGLEAHSMPTDAAPAPDSPATLAVLVAAEQAVLMVAAVLPEGQRRMRELAAQAVVAAEERLSLFRESGR